MKNLATGLAAVLLLGSCASNFPTGDISARLKGREAVYLTDASAQYSVEGGYGTDCAHPGAHALFNPGTYKIYAVLDGVISKVTSCSSAGDHAKYDIELVVGVKGETQVAFQYSLEPFGDSSCDSFASQIKVKAGDRVSKGDVIANYVAVGSGAHIHYNLFVDGAVVCPDIFPTSVFTSQTGTRQGCAAAAANTLCYNVTSSEDITRLY